MSDGTAGRRSATPMDRGSCGLGGLYWTGGLIRTGLGGSGAKDPASGPSWGPPAGTVGTLVACPAGGAGGAAGICTGAGVGLCGTTSAELTGTAQGQPPGPQGPQE